MALRSPALYMGNPAVNHTAQNDRLAKAGLLRPESGQTASNRPLTAASGVLAGPPGTMGEVTLLSNTQFTVNPGRWVIESTDTPLGGVYEVTNDAVETLAVTAQDATQWRKAYFGVWVIDSFVAGSGDDLPHWGLVNGPLAASNPQLPLASALPENFLPLGEFLIPPTGQAVTWTAYSLATGLRGSIVPVSAADTRNGSHSGSYRDHPQKGLQRWNGTAWVVSRSLPVFATIAARDAFYAANGAPVAGDQCLCLISQAAVPVSQYVTMTHDGTAWRFQTFGLVNVTTDASGLASSTHGGGQVPRGVTWGAAGCSTDAQTTIAKPMRWAEDATNLTVRFARTDTSGYFSNPGLGATYVATF